MFRALLALHLGEHSCIKQLLNVVDLNCNNWTTMHEMENVELVGHMILSVGGMWPLSQKLIHETEMVSFSYLAIAYISLGPWLHGRLRASLIRGPPFFSVHCLLSPSFEAYSHRRVCGSGQCCLYSDSVTGWRVRRSNPLEVISCTHVQTGCRSHSASCVIGIESLFCGSSRQGVSLTTLPHPASRLKKE